MAHDINYNKETGKHSFYSRKEVAWHKLGQVVEEAQTSKEAIVLSGLDYNVIKAPIYAKYPNTLQEKFDKKGIVVPNVFSTIREDTGESLGIVGNRYEIVQNIQAFDFIDEIVGSKEAIFETAGALGKGERIFVTAKLPNNIRIEGTDDIVENYILFHSTHDGSGSVIACFTPIRVVCNNTLNMALHSNRNKLVFRHTSSVHDKIKKGRELLGLYKRYSLEFSDTINALARKAVTPEIAESTLIDLVFTEEEVNQIRDKSVFSNDVPTRKRNKYLDILDYLDKGAGQDFHRGSALWLYNGVSTYYNNGKKYKDEEDRFNQLVDGKSYKDTQKIFNSLVNTL